MKSWLTSCVSSELNSSGTEIHIVSTILNPYPTKVENMVSL
jgi:hypothetical protein